VLWIHNYFFRILGSVILNYGSGFRRPDPDSIDIFVVIVDIGISLNLRQIPTVVTSNSKCPDQVGQLLTDPSDPYPNPQHWFVVLLSIHTL
jgi:hypothetical protein